MKVYADQEVIEIDCPVPDCKAVAGVWCGVLNGSPTAHERRIRARSRAAAGSTGEQT